MADKTKPTKHGGTRPGSGRFSKAEIEAIKRGEPDEVIAGMHGRSVEAVRAKRAKLSPVKPEQATPTANQRIPAEPRKGFAPTLQGPCG